MKIECPNCQNVCVADLETIPQGGVEIECPHCRFSFVMRDLGSHDVETTVDDLAAPGGQELSPEAAVLVGGRKIPGWMVEAYQTGSHPAPVAPPQEDGPSRSRQMDLGEPPEEAPLADTLDVPAPPTYAATPSHPAPEIPEDTTPTADMPVLVDEELVGEYVHERDGLASPASPRKMWRPDEKRKRSKRNRNLAVAVVAVAAVIVVVFLFLRASGLPGITQKGKDLGSYLSTFLPLGQSEQEKLEIPKFEGTFVKRVGDEGQIFVIRGKVTNGHDRSCASLQVKATILDEQRAPAGAETVFCGNTLTEAELATESESKIRAVLRNPMGERVSNLNIRPGDSIDFMVVFFDPPETISEFSIEIADYKLRNTEMD